MANFIVSPTNYNFKITDKIIINYSNSTSLTYGYLYGLNDGDAWFSESVTSSSMTFPPFDREGTYTCSISTYENGTNWIESNKFTITIGESVTPPTDNPPIIHVISDISAKVNQDINIVYTAIDDNEIARHEMSQNGGTTYSPIYPTKNANKYTHTLSYPSTGNRQCKIRVWDAKNQGATSNNFTISVANEVTTEPVSSVSVSPTSKTLTIDETFSISHTVLPSSATNKNVTWITSNSSIATVSNGVVRGVSKGTATITCKSVSDTSKTATCVVSVKDKPILEGLPAIWDNYTQSLKSLRQSMHSANIKIAQTKADQSVEVSKSYTESKIEILNDSISSKVSKSEFDTNNNEINSQFSELTQTVDSFEFNFASTRGGNRVKDSKVETTSGTYGFGVREITGGLEEGNYTLTVQGHKGTSNGKLRVYIYTTDWTFSSYVDIDKNIKTIQSVKFTIPPAHANKTLKIGSYNYPSGSSGTVRIDWYVVVKGDYGVNEWIPNNNELKEGVTTIDATGVKVLHKSGNYTKLGESGLEYFHANGSEMYHSLIAIIPFTSGSLPTDKRRIQLPNAFKGRHFFPVAIIGDTSKSTDVTSYPHCMHTFKCYVDKIDYTNATVDLIGFRLMKRWDNGEAWTTEVKCALLCIGTEKPHYNS